MKSLRWRHFLHAARSGVQCHVHGQLARSCRRQSVHTAARHAGPWTEGLSVRTAVDTRRGDIMASLAADGYYTTTGFLGADACAMMRAEAEQLYAGGEFMQSVSTDAHGQTFDKEGVHAVELDGDEWDRAAWLLEYTTQVMATIPSMLNAQWPELCMSDAAYGTKLAVATAGCGSKYPKHVDNSGPPDQRKLTVIYYLNPEWAPAMGGHLRLHVGGTEDEPVDITPEGDRVVMFWSDLCVHEVLPNLAPRGDRARGDRYALTLWLVSSSNSQICDETQPAWKTVLAHFPRNGASGDSEPSAEARAQAEAIIAAVRALSGRELCELASQAGVAIGAVGTPQDDDAVEGTEWWDAVATHPTLTPSERVRGRENVEADVICILNR